MRSSDDMKQSIQIDACSGFFRTSSPAVPKQARELNLEQAVQNSGPQTRDRSKASCESSLPGQRAGSRSGAMRLRPGLRRSLPEMGASPTHAKEAAKSGVRHLGERNSQRVFKAPAVVD